MGGRLPPPPRARERPSRSISTSSPRSSVLLDELNRRVGQTFTLAELAGAYQEADRWLLEVLPPGSGAIQVGLVEDAAFHLYARGAVDYRP